MKAKMFALAVFVVCGCWLLPASATITFTPGNNPQPDEANILFGASETGLTVTGEVDHTGVAAIFSSLTGETLLQMAKGQADIYNSALCPPPKNNHCDLTSMDFKLAPGFGFLDFIMNLQNGTGHALVTVLTEGSTFSYELGNGQNFLTIVASAGEVMTEIQVTADPAFTGTFGFEDFKQPRISGVCTIGATGCTPVPIVPEPGVPALLGIALLALVAVRRRPR